MYNKHYFHKINDKKVLHKVKKQWITVSLALLMMLGSGALATHITVSANINSNVSIPARVNYPQTSQQDDFQDSTTKVTNQATQIHSKLIQNADQKQIRLGAYRSIRKVRSHFIRTNSRRRLNRSGFAKQYYRKVPKGIPSHVIYNYYAPNDRRAAIPRRLKLLNHMAWIKKTPWQLKRHQGSIDLYIYNLRGSNWSLYPGPHEGRRKIRKNRWHAKCYSHAANTGSEGGLIKRRHGRKTRRTRKVRRRYHRQYTPKYEQTSYTPVHHATHRHKGYSGYYVISSDGEGDDLFMTNSDLQDLSNQSKASDGDYSDDFVSENHYSPLKARVVNTTNLDGYNLDQINHQVSDHNGDVWVFPKQLSHNPDGSFDALTAYNDMAQNILNAHKAHAQVVNDQVFNQTFTPDEKAQINNIKQQYSDLVNNEDSSDDMYSTKPDLSSGVVGSDSPEYIQHMVDWVNFYRGIYGLSPVSATSDYNNSAQYGADGCLALKDIEHGLNGMGAKPSNVSSDDWQKGIDATMHSNLDEGNTRPGDVIQDYFTDDQSDNVPGHRNWILDPSIQHIGVGQAGEYNDLRVVNSDYDNGNKTLYYPNSPVFPYEWATEGGAWSLMLPHDASVDSPQITVTDETTNQNVPITTTNTNNEYGDFGTVNFLPDMNYIKPNHEYNISINSNSGSWNWTTKLFKLTNDDN